MFSYRALFRQAWEITWRHKYLWFFGLFASLVAGTDNGGLHVATSSPMHLASLHADGGTATVANAPKGTYESSPTGNGISLEQQLMQVADTQLDHQTMANLYRKHIALLKSAIGAKSA